MPPTFMDQFSTKRKRVFDYANGSKTTQLLVYRIDKQPISLADVRKLTLIYSNQAYEKGGKVAVRGLAIDGYRTLKDEDNAMLTEVEYDDYYVNKVIVTQKYKNFQQLQIYVTK
jgi:hypothetical protein